MITEFVDRQVSISVVTAVHNAKRFITDCLQSVHTQLDNEISLEHIIVDGASTDGTIAILQSWQSKVGIGGEHYSFRFISEPDQGQSDAFNKGVAIAKGEWICWLNADDKLPPTSIIEFTKAIRLHPEVDVAYGHTQFIKEDETPAWISYSLPFYRILLSNGCYAPPSVGTFFRRDLLLRQLLDTDYHYVMDTEWFIRCRNEIRPLLVDHVFSHFRISQNAKTSEMIRSGQVTDQHYRERETYRKKYIYSRWPSLTEEQARKRFISRQKYFILLFKLLKLRYFWRYIKQKLNMRRMKC